MSAPPPGQQPPQQYPQIAPTPPPPESSPLRGIVVALVVVAVVLAFVAAVLLLANSGSEEAADVPAESSSPLLDRHEVGDCVTVVGEGISGTTSPIDCDSERFVPYIVASTEMSEQACESKGYPAYVSEVGTRTDVLCLVPSLQVETCYQQDTPRGLDLHTVDCEGTSSIITTAFKVLDRSDSKTLTGCSATEWGYDIESTPPREIGYCVQPLEG